MNVSPPLTVMQVLPRLDGGGVERGTLEVARALVEAGHRSVVVSAGGRLVKELVEGGSEHRPLNVGRKSPLTLLKAHRLRELWRDARADIVHVRSRLPAWVAYLAWRRLDPAERPHLVATVHGAYSVNRYSEIMTRGERVIAVSDTICEYILTNYRKVDPGRVVTIHRGVDATEFPFGYAPGPGWTRQWFSDFPELEGKQVLTIVGRLTRLKGHRDGLEALARLRARGLDVHGLFVGEAQRGRAGRRFQRELEADAAARGVPVTLAGHRADVRDIYAVSDVVMSPSTRPESFGRSVAEALYLGRPVVGYDHGGVGEILRAMYPYGAVSPGDTAALAEAAAVALSGEVPVVFEDRFPLRGMLDRTLALYESLGPRGSNAEERPPGPGTPGS